jgi:hypothetical protein
MFFLYLFIFTYFKEVLLLVEAALVGNRKPHILATNIHAYMSLCLCSGSGYPDNLPQPGPQAMFLMVCFCFLGKRTD